MSSTEFLDMFLRNPILVIFATISMINLFFIFKVLRRNQKTKDILVTEDFGESKNIVDQIDVHDAEPERNKMVYDDSESHFREVRKKSKIRFPLKGIKIKENVANNSEEILEPEIRSIPDTENFDVRVPLETDRKEREIEIRPLLSEKTRESCEYCAIFKDIGTMICPHCGRPLNLRVLQH